MSAQRRTWFDLVTLDVVEPRSAARFWCDVLGLVIQEDEDDGRWLVLGDADGRRAIGLQRSTESEVRARPRSCLHLDVQCDQREFSDRLDEFQSGGARLLGPARDEPYGVIANLMSPDGIQFCLYAYPDGIKPTERGPRPFLDMITSDVVDTRSAAQFWCDVAGMVVLEDEDDGRAVIIGLPDGLRLLGFHRSEPGDVASRARSRLHLDLECTPEDFDFEWRRLIDVGAVRIGPRREERFGSNQMYLDPSGTAFCLNSYILSETDGRLMDAYAPGRPAAD